MTADQLEQEVLKLPAERHARPIAVRAMTTRRSLAPTRVERWRARAEQLGSEVKVLRLAYSDVRTPRLAKVVTLLVIAYAVSPIDLIPDFIPVLGYVDDFILIPAGITLVLRLIPPEVVATARSRSMMVGDDRSPASWLGPVLVIIAWTCVAAGVASFAWLRQSA